MNIEKSIEILKMWNKAEELVINESTDYDKTVYIQRKEAIETLLTAYEKEKEKNKSLEQENSFLKMMYRGTDEFKAIENLAKEE